MPQSFDDEVQIGESGLHRAIYDDFKKGAARAVLNGGSVADADLALVVLRRCSTVCAQVRGRRQRCAPGNRSVGQDRHLRCRRRSALVADLFGCG